MSGSLRASTCRAMLAYCDRIGVARSQIIQAAGVDPALLATPDGVLTMDQVIALWMHGYTLTGDENLALHAAEWAAQGTGGSLMYFLCANAPTVGSAFGKVTDYSRGIDNTTKFSILEEPSKLAMRIDKRSTFSATRPELEWLMAAIYCGIRAATGVAFHALAVEFAVAAPQDTREHERVFGCPVRFDQGASRVWVSRVDWERQNKNANAELLRILELRARGMVAEVPELDSVRDTVRAVACLNLDQGPLTIEQVAKQLSLSARTLQRRLATEGASFSELVDQARETTSRRLLREHNLSLAEIAHLVGFSEQSAFTRAFKKWTGTTPAQFRRSAVAGYSTT